MYAFTLLVTVALAAVMNASAADSNSHESYGDGSRMRDSDYYDDNHQAHDYDHHHDRSSHGPHFESHKTLVTRSLLPEEDSIAEVQAEIPDVEAEIATPLSDVNPISEGAAFTEEVTEEDSPLNDVTAEGAALTGITENSSPINSLPSSLQMDPYRGQPIPPPAPDNLPPRPHYPPPPPPGYGRYPPPHGPRNPQYNTSPPPPPPNPYGPPPPPPNPYGPPPPRSIPA